MKILILKPSSLGDVIQALPVLRLLKLHWRQAEIFWWIDAPLAPLLEGDPDLAGVVPFERRRWSQPRYWPEMCRSIRRLREKDFDLVIDLQCLARSAAFAWLANGKKLVGLDEVREGARAFYDSVVPRKSFHTHAVDWYLSILPPLKVPVHERFDWLPFRPAVAAGIRQKWPDPVQDDHAQNLDGRPSKSGLEAPGWIALQPGARWQNKRWPVENFAELVRLLVPKYPESRFVILGDRGDDLLGSIITEAAPERCLNLCGATSLPEMVEWIRRCDLMITNDTGPMHVAAALKKRLVALFGPTEPRRTGPYGQLENVVRVSLPCSPCMKPRCGFEKPEECLRALSPAQVMARFD
ncbi:MAG TPA: lipopolysaccharide heptosyltransferase II [Candidatus Acidoferrales bacterium]|nr:lipopolysaccharide heptosyltransferase II [Candidatus Acidoferrales bacterium]